MQPCTLPHVLLLLLLASVSPCCAQPNYVTTLAGSNSFTVGSTDGVGTAAKFYNPYGISLGPDGVAYVADAGNHLIRAVSAVGNVTTVAGRAVNGSADGVGSNAQFNGPSGIAVDAAGYIYVADTGNHAIRTIAPDYTVTTLAGGSSGFVDGQGSNAKFNGPKGIAVDALGIIYVADTGNHAIRVVYVNGTVTTLAGNGTASLVNQVGTSATFSGPTGVAVDAQSNVLVADAANNVIRLISPNGSVITIAGSGALGSLNGACCVAPLGLRR